MVEGVGDGDGAVEEELPGEQRIGVNAGFAEEGLHGLDGLEGPAMVQYRQRRAKICWVVHAQLINISRSPWSATWKLHKVSTWFGNFAHLFSQ